MDNGQPAAWNRPWRFPYTVIVVTHKHKEYCILLYFLVLYFCSNVDLGSSYVIAIVTPDSYKESGTSRVSDGEFVMAYYKRECSNNGDGGNC